MPGLGQLEADAIALVAALVGLGVLVGFLLGRWTARR